jgi:hypothetical protein
MIGPEEIAALAELYDRFANAFDRTSPDRAQARRQFYARLEMLYEQEGHGFTNDGTVPDESPLYPGIR